MYWWGHVLAVAAIIILTLFPLQKTRSKPRQNDVTKTNIEVNNDVNQHTKAGWTGNYEMWWNIYVGLVI